MILAGPLSLRNMPLVVPDHQTSRPRNQSSTSVVFLYSNMPTVIESLPTTSCAAHQLDQHRSHHASSTGRSYQPAPLALCSSTDNFDMLRPKASTRRRVSGRLAGWPLFGSVLRPILMLYAALKPVAAAKIPFENCLPESYINNVPTPLQWVPVWVDASFNSVEPKHTLSVTMWGNVTGAFANVTLPPPDSPDWQDPSKPDGKILGQPEPDVPNPKLTTLHSKIEVLTYEPWSENTNFCNTSLINGSCPLAPRFLDKDSRYTCLLLLAFS